MDKDTVKGWLVKADHDLEVTRHSEILPSDVVCYHAQQAAEKYLKAFLIANDIEIKNIQIHDIDRLLVECTLINPEFEKLSNMGIGKLTDYAVGIRYPNDYNLYDNFNVPSAKETNKAISLAQTTVSFVREKINIKQNISQEKSKPKQKQEPANTPKPDAFSQVVNKEQVKRKFGR